MRLLDVTFDTPAMNLAFDETLLDRLERGEGGDSLRFWESPAHFVVLGVAQTLAAEVHEDACVELGVPILRRCSAGGCVLQGPGCLNYTLALRYDLHTELRGVRSSYGYLLGKLAGAFASRGITLTHKGISDLSMGELKVSGNAQKRRRAGLLHHGTLVYGLSPTLVARCLREPEERPDYRGPRDHGAFMGSLGLSAADLRALVCQAFGAPPSASAPDEAEVMAAEELARSKYSSADWIRRR